MIYLSYSIKSSVKAIAREKWINLLCITTVASSLLMVIMIGLFLYNIHWFVDRLHERFGMVLFLDENISEKDTKEILEKLKKRQEIEGLRYISKDEALKELKESLKDYSYVLEGLEVNPLSPAIEIKLKRSYINPNQVSKTAVELKSIKGVEEVYSAERIADTISTFYRSVTNIGLIIFSTLVLGIVFVIYSTVKILLYRKKDEIETMKLLGATRSFIRTPFLIEGGIIGLLGGLISVGLTVIFYFALTYRLSAVLPAIQTFLFPIEIIVVFPAIGAVLGVVGSFIAVGRLRY